MSAHVRRKVYWFGALGIASLALLLPSDARWIPLAWAGYVFVVGALVGRQVLSFSRGGLVSSMGGVLFLPLLLVRLDAHFASLATLLVCMPLIIAALVPDDRGSVVVFSVGAVVWLGWSAWSEPSDHVRWLLLGCAVVCGGLSLAATVRHQRVEQARELAVQARLTALSRLAQSERERSRVERLAVIGQLVAGVAHELNNPLAWVASSLSFLKEPGSDAEERAAAWRDVEQGLLRLRRTVEDLGQLARPEEPGAEGHVGAAADTAEKEAVARCGGDLRVERHLPPDLPLVAMSEGRLVQVLGNLLVNAADAMAGQQPRVVLLRGRASASEVTLIVEDSGPGLPPEVLTRVFDPWFSTKGRQGSGLGLALCRELVQSANGALVASNREQGGARFTLTLPLKSGESPPPAPS